MKKAPPLLSEAFIPVYPSLSTRYGVCGAMIIAQVHFMCYQKANDKAGYRWCYNSYAQWSELLPFSAMTIRRTLKDLELDGVIIAASYNRHGWDKTKWYRVCYEQLDLIKLNIPPDHDEQCLAIMENKPIPDNHPDTISDNSFTTFSSPTGIENMKIEKNNSGVKAPVKKPSSSDAILAALQIKNGASPTSNHKEIMRAVWREVPKYNKDVGMVPVLTGKDVGNLSYIATSIGPTAEGVLRHIISNWIAFTKFVESAKAVKKTPSAPDIGFVVKYVTEAVSFQKQSVQSVAPKSKAGKIASPVKIQTPPAIESKAHEAEEDAEITLDAVMAWEPKPK